MDFLTQQEISGIRQDAQHGLAMQETGKMEYERKLREGLGQEMNDVLEHPEKAVKYVDFAKKYQKKKRNRKWKENLRKILGFKDNHQEL